MLHVLAGDIRKAPASFPNLEHSCWAVLQWGLCCVPLRLPILAPEERAEVVSVILGEVLLPTDGFQQKTPLRISEVSCRKEYCLRARTVYDLNLRRK
jgi:hypothetical protein